MSKINLIAPDVVFTDRTPPRRSSTTDVAELVGKVIGLVLVIGSLVTVAMCSAWLLLQLGRVLFGAA